MQDVLSRLRAALTPQALLFLAALLLLALGMPGKDQDSSSALEKRIEKTLSAVEGAGRVRVVIRTKTINSTGALSSGKEQSIVCGAAAVAPGAADPLVRLELEQALCALLDLPASAVSVMTGGE